MAVLILGLVLFLGAHSFPMAAPAQRARLKERLGENGYKGVYTLVAVAGFVLVVWGYGLARADPVALWVPPVWTRHLSLLIMLPAFPLFFAAALPGRIQSAVGHPMLAAVKVWAFAHLLANGTLADVVLFGSFLVWAVADRISFRYRHQDPIPGAPPGKYNDAIAVGLGLALYLAFIFGLHRWLIGVSPLVVPAA